MVSLVDKDDRGKWPSKKKNKNQKGERGAAAAPSGEGEEGVQLLGFFFFFCVAFSYLQNCPPLQNQCSMVFIGKILLGFQISPSTFPFLLFSSFFL